MISITLSWAKVAIQKSLAPLVMCHAVDNVNKSDSNSTLKITMTDFKNLDNVHIIDNYLKQF